MLTVTFTRLRNNAKKYFDAVERGESVEIYRYGKPIAVLTPPKTAARARWKTGNPLRLEGVSLSKRVLAER
jgi:prevent-host-death family protein